MIWINLSLYRAARGTDSCYASLLFECSPADGCFSDKTSRGHPYNFETSTVSLIPSIHDLGQNCDCKERFHRSNGSPANSLHPHDGASAIDPLSFIFGNPDRVLLPSSRRHTWTAIRDSSFAFLRLNDASWRVP